MTHPIDLDSAPVRDASPPASEPRAAGSARRQRVIDGAAAIFAQHGYHGMGMRAIAETLGIKAASLYCHVASKEEALEEVCHQGISLPLARLIEACETEISMAARLRSFLYSQIEFYRKHGDYAAVFLQERRHLPPDAGERIEAFSRAFRAALDRLFAEAESRGELHPALTPRSASLITIGTIRTLNQFYIQGPIRGFDAFASDAIETLIRGLSPAGAAVGPPA